jgi:hypothetical protein
MDVTKVDRDVAYVASVLQACCKGLFKMFHLFQTYVASFFDLDVAHILHICCKSMFKVFQLFQSYVAISVFMLQVKVFYLDIAYVFINMLQVYVPNVSSASDASYIQVFSVSEVCSESHRAQPKSRG